MSSLSKCRVALVVGLVSLCACVQRAGRPESLEGMSRAPASRDYRLQIGDELDIRFYKTPELNSVVKVRSDGRISLELIDDIDVAGLRPAELDRVLSERYATELREPSITVVVKDFGGERVYVGGEVVNPGVLRLAGEMTALQAIQEAQGFKDTASPKSVLLIRRGKDGERHGETIDLAAAVSGHGPEGDVFLEPFDVLYVPRSHIADVDLFVDQYIRKVIPVQPSIGAGF